MSTKDPAPTSGTTDGDRDDPPAGDDRDAEPATPPSDDEVGDTSGDTSEDKALAAQRSGARGQLASFPGMPRPPRRTGVFLDPQDLRSHVSDLLRSIVGPHTVDPFGNFTFDHETVRIFVTVAGSPIGPVVGVFSVTNADLELDAGLASFLARTNHRLLLGTLSWDDDNDAVWLRHNLLGTHLDPPELQAAVRSVSSAAVAIAGQVHEQFGGRRFGVDDGDENPPGEPPMAPPDMTGDGGDDGMDGPRRSNATGYL